MKKGRKQGFTHSLETKLKMGISKRGVPKSEEHRKKISTAMKGDKAPNWQGGVSKPNEIVRKSLEYKLWREAVYKRDKYCCIWCGKTGKNLEADHIKPFSLFPALRFAIDNGRTLCHDCHTKTDTYGPKLLKKKN